MRGMTAFNMEDEKDEGYFDANGNFVWNNEANKQEEAWLEDISEEQMGAAKHAKTRREYRDEQTEETLTIETANNTLATLLHSRETVLKALKRLGSKTTTRGRSGNKRKLTHRNETQTLEEKKQFEQITEAADFLMRLGVVEVYSQIKEEFVLEEEIVVQRRQVQFVEENEGKSQDKQEIMWEYKANDEQIYGPFPTSCFMAWQQQGYFQGETAVDMRQVRSFGDAATVQPANKKQKQADEKVSAEQEMLDDFEDSDVEKDTRPADDKKNAYDNSWKRSDTIVFSLY